MQRLTNWENCYLERGTNRGKWTLSPYRAQETVLNSTGSAPPAPYLPGNGEKIRCLSPPETKPTTPSKAEFSGRVVVLSVGWQRGANKGGTGGFVPPVSEIDRTQLTLGLDFGCARDPGFWDFRLWRCIAFSKKTPQIVMNKLKKFNAYHIYIRIFLVYSNPI